MSEPFEQAPGRDSSGFASPEAELEHLRAQVAEKERQLAELGHNPEKEAVAHDALQHYKDRPTHEVLHDSHQLSGAEKQAIVLDLPPDNDDAAMQELLGIVQEKGIKNAMDVALELKNPHLEDDFHRALVQYVLQGYQAPDLNEKTPLWNVLNLSLFEVTLPGGRQDNDKKLDELVSAMEQFYLGMFSIDAELRSMGDRYFSIELAVSGEREDIVFYMAVPRDKEHLFEKQLASVFPKARAHHTPNDYNIFQHDGATAVAYGQLKEDPILPIKDYREFDHDPLAALINTLTKIDPVGEGAAIQFVVNPLGSVYLKRYKKVLEKLEKGMDLHEALRDTPEDFSGEVFKVLREFVVNKKDKDEAEEADQKTHNQQVIEQVRKKIESPIPGVNMRLIASAQSQARADAILHDIVSSFNQFYNTTGNRLRFEQPKSKAALTMAKEFTFRRYVKKNSIPLSVRELASLMHFPDHSFGSTTPQLKTAQAAEAPAPIGLPTDGLLLGANEYRGQSTKIYLTPDDRLRHMYIIGQTGTGKSHFIRSQIVQDIQNGEGVCFIDPHGADIEKVLESVPEHRFQDVIYFDPSDSEHVLGLNMLEYDSRVPTQKTFVINELFSIFQKLYSGTPESMGPAFEQYFRNATALVLEDPSTGCTMLDISRVLADAKYREVKLARSQNPVVNQFWREIATKAQGEASLQNIVPYITNKFDIFTANDIMRPIIAQQKSAFNIREVMDSRKILLVNLSKGKLGDINANLIGMVLVGKMLMAALSRVDALASDLPPFYLYIDEFQNITTDSISAILSEARKYKLSLTMAHQFIAQLDDGIREAVFGNVGNKAVFRVGADDAEYLESQFAPIFEAQDIMNITNRHAYLSILAHGVPQNPFSISTLPFAEGSPERSAYLKKLSNQTYARSAEEVNREVKMRYSIG